MLAGKLRQRITIETPAVVRGASGEAQQSWSTFATVWARIEPNFGKSRSEEVLQGGAISASRLHQVTMRYLAGLDTIMRIKFGTRTFQITEIVNIEERNREQRLLCIETE